MFLSGLDDVCAWPGCEHRRRDHAPTGLRGCWVQFCNCLMFTEEEEIEEMPIVVSEAKKDYAPAPQGLHHAVCCDVVDLGVVEVTYQKQTKKQHKVRIVWEINEANPDNGKPFTASRRYTASLDPKSSLRKDLESWRGRPFTPEELKGFDLEKLIGANAMLNVMHQEREGSTYANVTAITPLMKGLFKLAVSQGYVRSKDRDGQQPGDDAPPPLDDDAPAF